MDVNYNITRFEAEMSEVHREGVDKLMEYIRKSDFYSAPASTKYHLSVSGGLLQHSLNVLDALRGLLRWNEDGGNWEYMTAGQVIASVPNESVTIMALLHDICKTHFYTVSTRNAKNEKTGEWEKVPFFAIDDKMPLGHGDKSAMIIKQYMNLTNAELYAIWWHMGISDGGDIRQFGQAIDKYPIVYALHTADMMASHFMEATGSNRPPFDIHLSDETGEATMDEHLEGEAKDGASTGGTAGEEGQT